MERRGFIKTLIGSVVTLPVIPPISGWLFAQLFNFVNLRKKELDSFHRFEETLLMRCISPGIVELISNQDPIYQLIDHGKVISWQFQRKLNA